MVFEIKNHRIVGASYIPSPNHGGKIKPDGAVMHWTAGATAQGAISTFKSRASQASAHFVIHADGDVTQMVPLNVRAWHAGPSIMNGRGDANGWTHGFEIVNPGFYLIRGDKYYDWTGKNRISDNVLAMWPPDHKQKFPKVGGGLIAFPAFKEPQLETALELLKATSAHYSYTNLAGHDEIDRRGWKADPGPIFPWSRFDAVVGGTACDHCPPDIDVPRGDIADEPIASRGQDYTGRQMQVTASSLRVRKGPGTHWKHLVSISRGTRVEVLRDEGDWVRVSFNGGLIGWVAERFLETV